MDYDIKEHLISAVVGDIFGTSFLEQDFSKVREVFKNSDDFKSLVPDNFPVSPLAWLKYPLASEYTRLMILIGNEYISAVSVEKNFTYDYVKAALIYWLNNFQPLRYPEIEINVLAKKLSQSPKEEKMPTTYLGALPLAVSLPIIIHARDNEELLMGIAVFFAQFFSTLPEYEEAMRLWSLINYFLKYYSKDKNYVLNLLKNSVNSSVWVERMDTLVKIMRSNLEIKDVVELLGNNYSVISVLPLGIYLAFTSKNWRDLLENFVKVSADIGADSNIIGFVAFSLFYLLTNEPVPFEWLEFFRKFEENEDLFIAINQLAGKLEVFEG